MRKVSDVLQVKGHFVWSIRPTALVYDAICLLAEKGIGALLVIEGTQLVGIFSERDYARRIILEGRSSESTQVKEVMSRSVICVTPDQDVEECLALMTDKHVRHLPVTKEDQIVGVLSIGDLVKSVIDEQRSTIEQLQRYITG